MPLAQYSPNPKKQKKPRELRWTKGRFGFPIGGTRPGHFQYYGEHVREKIKVLSCACVCVCLCPSLCVCMTKGMRKPPLRAPVTRNCACLCRIPLLDFPSKQDLDLRIISESGSSSPVTSTTMVLQALLALAGGAILAVLAFAAYRCVVAHPYIRLYGFLSRAPSPHH